MPRFDVTIAGELNLDLIFYGLPEQLPRSEKFLPTAIFHCASLAIAFVVLNSRVRQISAASYPLQAKGASITATILLYPI